MSTVTTPPLISVIALGVQHFVPLRITARRGPFRIVEYEREMLMSPDSGCELRAPGI